MANDTAKSTLLLDGKQAIAEMDRLIAKNKELKEARDKAMMANDLQGFKKFDDAIKENDKSLRSYRKAVFDTEAVLKNLNGSTLQDLKKTASIIEGRMKGMARGTEEWKQSASDLGRVKTEISGVKSEMNGASTQSSKFSGIWGKMGGIVTMVGGAISSAYGAIKFGQSIIESSEALSDRWTKTTTGLKSAWDSFKSSIATADFSNLIGNMKDAIKIGQQYAETIDNIEDRRRGLSIAEAKAQKELSDMRVKMMDVNLTPKGRQAWADEIIKKEQEIANMRLGIAEDDRKASIDRITGIKKVSEADVQAFIEFKGTTEQKVALADDYMKKERELARMQRERTSQGMAWAAGGTAKQSVASVATQEEIKLQNELKNTEASIKSMANVIKGLSPKEIEELTDKTVEYYNAQANVSQVVESTLVKKNKLEAKEAKQAEQEKTNLEKYRAKVEELRVKIEDLKLANKPVDKSLIDEFVNKSNALFVLNEDIDNLTKSIKELTFDWSEMEAEMDVESFKAIKEEAESLADEIWKTAQDISTEDAEKVKTEFQNKIDKQNEWVSVSIESARVVSDSIFDIIAQNDQAILDNRLSMLDKQKQKELDNKNLTEKQKNDIEEKYRVKAAALKREAFIKQRNADIIQNIINTAMAVTAALTSVPPNPAMAILAGITGAAQTVVIASQPIPEFASGRYDVTGQSGKNYKADYTGPAVTGLYTRPAIVGETGSEIIIDPATTRNLQMNFPDVIQAINNARVGGSGGGGARSAGSGGGNFSLKDAAFVAAVSEFKAVVQELKTGIPAKVYLNDLEDIQEKKAGIEAATEL